MRLSKDPLKTKEVHFKGCRPGIETQLETNGLARRTPSEANALTRRKTASGKRDS